MSEGKKIQNNMAGEIAAQHIDPKKRSMSDHVSFLSTRKKVV